MSLASRPPPVIDASLPSDCAPTTPLFIAQVTINKTVEYKTLKTKRMTAITDKKAIC